MFDYRDFKFGNVKFKQTIQMLNDLFGENINPTELKNSISLIINFIPSLENKFVEDQIHKIANQGDFSANLLNALLKSLTNQNSQDIDI